jgi:hypothetical protein
MEWDVKGFLWFENMTFENSSDNITSIEIRQASIDPIAGYDILGLFVFVSLFTVVFIIVKTSRFSGNNTVEL